MEVKATLKYGRLGTQKARLVADVVRGMDVNEAIKSLTFMKQKPALIIKKLIESAVANAEDKQVIDVDNLYIKTIYVDKAPDLKRYRPRAQGRAFTIRKKQSHINVILDER